jgi:hypothetical protein
VHSNCDASLPRSSSSAVVAWYDSATRTDSTRKAVIAIIQVPKAITHFTRRSLGCTTPGPRVVEVFGTTTAIVKLCATGSSPNGSDCSRAPPLLRASAENPPAEAAVRGVECNGWAAIDLAEVELGRQFAGLRTKLATWQAFVAAAKQH